MSADEKVEVENVNHPGSRRSVDASKYDAMKQAMLKVLPIKAPGLSDAEIVEAVVGRLPTNLFPGGAAAGWWAKTVQVDLEAKGIIHREKTKPLRWRRG